MREKLNKKGQLGMDLAQKFVLGLLVLVVLGVVVVIVVANLNTSSGITGIAVSGSITSNQTFALTDAGTAISGIDTRATLANVIITNATGGETITITGNYTISGTTVTAVGASSYNGTNANITATWSYNDNTIGSITNNVSTATEGFFGNATTWFAMLAIAILILIIAIVILAVRGFGGRGNL